jgi:hypothetical protein
MAIRMFRNLRKWNKEMKHICIAEKVLFGMINVSFLNMDVSFKIASTLANIVIAELKSTPSDINLLLKTSNQVKERVPSWQPLVKSSWLFLVDPKECSCLNQLIVKMLLCLRITLGHGNC